MAKLTLSLDTETKTIEVDVDGTRIDNINEVTISNWGYNKEPSYTFTVTTAERVGDVSKVTRLMAKDTQTAKEAIAEGKARPSKRIAGFVEIEGKTRAQQAFIDMWQRGRKLV